jgi:hypothetical protein
MALQINYNKQEQIKEALEMAICYCIDNSKTSDTWSAVRLSDKQKVFEDLLNNIGSSYVIADDPNY